MSSPRPSLPAINTNMQINNHNKQGGGGRGRLEEQALRRCLKPTVMGRCLFWS